MSYRKRDIAHWNQGKSCKGTRKAKERAYVDKEIEEQVAVDQDENFRYRHYRHKSNKIAQLENRIAWYEKVILEDARDKSSWRSYFVNYARNALTKAKKQLKELQEKLCVHSKHLDEVKDTAVSMTTVQSDCTVKNKDTVNGIDEL